MLTDADIARLALYWLAILHFDADGVRTAPWVPSVPVNATEPAGVC